MSVTIDNLNLFADERGVVIEPIIEDSLPDQNNAHVTVIRNPKSEIE